MGPALSSRGGAARRRTSDIQYLLPCIKKKQIPIRSDADRVGLFSKRVVNEGSVWFAQLAWSCWVFCHSLRFEAI